jgi:hypothetical protein
LTSPHDTILLHFNADSFRSFPYLPLAAVRPRRIGYWAGAPVLPPQWTPALAKLHELWVPSRYVAETVTSATTKRSGWCRIPCLSRTMTRPMPARSKPASRHLFVSHVFDRIRIKAQECPGTIHAFLTPFPIVEPARRFCRQMPWARQS